jgi:hypothetical protein
MTFNSNYKMLYTVDNEQSEMIIEVKLLPIKGIKKPLQNVYEGHVTVNDIICFGYDLSSCVDADCAIEEIAAIEKTKLKKSLRSDKKNFRLIKEIFS